MEGRTLRPFGDYLYFRKCQRPDVEEAGKILLYIPDELREFTNWCELIAVGPKCRYVTADMIGGLSILPEMDNHMHRLGQVRNQDAEHNEDWAIREAALLKHCPAIYIPEAAA